MGDLNLSTLCLACKAIFKAEPSDSTPSFSGRNVAHHDIEALSARAVRGCHLCLTVYMSLDPDALANFRRLHRNSQGLASVTPIARDQARLKFTYLPEDGGNTQSYHSKSSASSTSNNALVVELILLKPEYAVEPGVRTLPDEAISTGSDESLATAKAWLDDCSFNHMKCSVSVTADSSWKPTHLLDVSIKGPKGAPGIKLVDGMFLDPITEYVTLSHTWGHSKPIRLNKKTLPALRQGVATATLPKTFADAAHATLQLGFRYLWIDALCIMHDTEGLVLTEIAQMGKVYTEATVNLAATSAHDDATGLFYTRNIAALQPAVVSVQGHGIDDGVYKVLRSTVWSDLVAQSPLSKRAWVFQERCLAKRTIHFSRSELLFECQQMACSEVFPKGLPTTSNTSNGNVDDDRLIFNKRAHHQKTGNNWPALVHMYSQGRLTYQSDKLLAMAGLTGQYMARNRLRPADYIAGMWRAQLPGGLLWRIENGRAATKFRAPSWSWASLDGVATLPDPSPTPNVHASMIPAALSVGGVLSPLGMAAATGMGMAAAAKTEHTIIEILDIDIQYKQATSPESTSSVPLFAGAPIASANLKVRGCLLKGVLLRTHDYWGPTSCVIQVSRGQGQTQQIELESASFDARLPKLSAINALGSNGTNGRNHHGVDMTEQLEVYLLPVLETLDRIEGLLLCATVIKGKKAGYFRRIGVWDVSRWDQIAWGAVRDCVSRGDEALGNFEERTRKDASESTGGAGGLGGVDGGLQGEYLYTINLV